MRHAASNATQQIANCFPVQWIALQVSLETALATVFHDQMELVLVRVNAKKLDNVRMWAKLPERMRLACAVALVAIKNYLKFLKVPLVLSQVVCTDFDSPRKSFGKPLRYYFRLVLYNLRHDLSFFNHLRASLAWFVLRDFDGHIRNAIQLASPDHTKRALTEFSLQQYVVCR